MTYDLFTSYLQNGMQVIMHNLPNSFTVGCSVWIKQGSKYETLEQNGLSHLIEHLLINRDNNKKPKFQECIWESFDEGVSINAGTTKEHTYYYMTGLNETLNLCLKTLSNIVVENQDFDQNMFDNEKKVVEQEAISFYTSFNQIQERTSQALWGNENVGRIIVGDVKNITEAKIEYVKSIIEDSYVPENAVLVIVGKINYVETLKLVEEYFSAWEDKTRKKYNEILDHDPSIFFNFTENTQSAVISYGFRGLPYLSEGRNNLKIICKIIGDPGFQSRLVSKIRIENGLAYTVGAFNNTYEKCGSLGLTAVTANQNVNRVSELIAGELNDIRKNGFSKEEVQRAKKSLETKTLLELNDLSAHLLFLGKTASFGGHFSLEQELRNIKKINDEDVYSVFEEVFTEERLGIAAIGNIDIDKMIETFQLV